MTGDAQHHQRRPRLAQLTGTQVALVVGLDAVESPGPVPSAVGGAFFEGWGAWPATLGPQAVFSSVGGADVRASRSGSGELALLFHTDDTNPPTPPLGLSVGQGITPTMPVANPSLLDASQPTPPLFLAASGAGDGGLLAGWSWELPLNSLHYGLRFAPIGKTPGAVIEGLACGTQDLHADAVASGTGFLVAASTSAPFGMCGVGGAPGPDGPPNRLQLARVDKGIATFGDEKVEIGPILGVSMAPRTDGGAWVVWLPTGDPAAAPPRASRVDAAGKLVGPSFVVGSAGTTGYAVSSLGDRLVVAALSTLDPSAPPIVVTIYDDAGGPVTAASFQPPGGAFAAGDLAVLGAPAGVGLAVMIAWDDATGGAATKTHVARLSCTP